MLQICMSTILLISIPSIICLMGVQGPKKNYTSYTACLGEFRRKTGETFNKAYPKARFYKLFFKKYLYF